MTGLTLPQFERMKKQWFLLETDSDYEVAVKRYEELKSAKKDAADHKEKLLLVSLIQQYEASKWNLSELDRVE